MKREIIESRHNPLIVHVKKLLCSRSYREKNAEFAADGTKLLHEAVKWYPNLSTVIVQEGVEICPLPENVRVVQVSQSIMRDLSPMEAPQGAVFVCKLPAQRQVHLQGGCIVLDGIQDPGNLGTILRTADALELPVILTEGCCDAYNPKTVRASMGAVFRTQPVCMTKEQVVEQLRKAGVSLYATAMSDDARDLREVDLKKAAVVIGSEGQGICPMLMNACRGKIIIPMNSRCESLNAAVAATIVMWQMKR